MSEHAWLFRGWCRNCPQPFEWMLPVNEWPGPRAKCDDCGTIIIWGNPEAIGGRFGTPRKLKDETH